MRVNESEFLHSNSIVITPNPSLLALFKVTHNFFPLFVFIDSIHIICIENIKKLFAVRWVYHIDQSVVETLSPGRDRMLCIFIVPSQFDNLHIIDRFFVEDAISFALSVIEVLLRYIARIKRL